MEDLMIIEYLKRKGLYNLSDKEFDDRFKDIMYHHYMKDYKEPSSHTSSIRPSGKSVENAKYLVSKMFHHEEGKKYVGEKFDLYKAKEICERYRAMLPSNVDEIDMYIAVNAHYHDYSELFKQWFGTDIEHRIIESAIKFWFRDEDCNYENKVMAHFK